MLVALGTGGSPAATVGADAPTGRPHRLETAGMLAGEGGPRRA